MWRALARFALASTALAACGPRTASRGRLVSRPHRGAQALLTYPASGRAKVAFVVVHRPGPSEIAGGPWKGEAWAQCDPAEFDPATDSQHDVELWSEPGRACVPAAVVHSRVADAHCHAGGSRLQLARAEHSFVRDPEGTWAAKFLALPYEADSTLPPDAVDTGFSRGDTHLWLAADERAAYTVTGEGVERWPAQTIPQPCA